MILKQLIFEQEKALLEFPNRASIDYLNKTLADGFIEFTSTGHRYSKIEIINQLKNSKPIHYTISNFELTVLSESVALATFKIIINDQPSLRSSVWVLNNKEWQMEFHQGTKCG